MITQERILKCVLLLASASVFAVPAFASAQTLSSQDNSAVYYPANHQLWDRGTDVKALQEFLDTHGAPLAQSGPGSLGDETTLFGLRTYHAVLTYQEENGLPATGYFGPLTRAMVNSVISAQSSASNGVSNTSSSSPTPSSLQAVAPVSTNAPQTLYEGTEEVSGAVSASSTVATVSGSTAVSSSCSQASAFFARTSGLSSTETTAYNDLICGMVTDGTWPLMDAFYIFATNNTTTANLNLIDSNYELIPHGDVTFEADHGYTGDGSTGYLDTGFTGGNYSSTNSASLGIYNLTNSSSTNRYVDVGRSITGSSFDGCVSGGFTGGVSAVGFATNAIATATSTNSQGEWICTRTSPTLFAQYKNGNPIPVVVGTGPVAPASTSTIYILALDAGGSPYFASGNQLSAAFIGGGLTATQAATVASRVNAFMQALGINVY